MLGYLQVVALFLVGFHSACGTDKNEECCIKKYPSYYVSLKDKPMDYFEAKLFCRRKGLELVSIESEEEQQFLNEHLAKLGAMDKQFWLSGSSWAKSGLFSWYGTGKLLSYTNWSTLAQRVPKKCMYMLAEKEKMVWMSDGCETKKYLVCEGYNSYM